MNCISQNLKLLRKRFNLTQDDLAVKINNKRSNVAAWEDKRAQPSIDVLIQLSNFFNISLNDFISTELNDDFFNMLEEPIHELQMDHKSCLRMVEYLEKELSEKNQLIKSLINLMKDYDKVK